mmetsp:Transcript_81903/g.240415  ORF Transcript_81903/g.240415 Transcript_81903/m.240415 type:complete len:206 (-) Transcript_81903:166-783(-)
MVPAEHRCLGPRHRPRLCVGRGDAGTGGVFQRLDEVSAGGELRLTVGGLQELQDGVGAGEPCPLVAAKLGRKRGGPVHLVAAVAGVAGHEALDVGHKAGTDAEIVDTEADLVGVPCVVDASAALLLLQQVVVDLRHLLGLGDAVRGRLGAAVRAPALREEAARLPARVGRGSGPPAQLLLALHFSRTATLFGPRLEHVQRTSPVP